jgi:hypothetical protein
MPTRSIALLEQSDFFATAPVLPEGFAYREDVVSADEEHALVEHFAKLPFKPFEFHGFLGKRQVISFGWRYDFAGRELRDSDPIPSFLLPLRQKAADFAGVPAESLEQILINEYGPGAGIGWHRDKPMFQGVIAVSCWRPVCCGFGASVAPYGSGLPATFSRVLPISCGGRYGGIGSIVSRPSSNGGTR